MVFQCTGIKPCREILVCNFSFMSSSPVEGALALGKVPCNLCGTKFHDQLPVVTYPAKSFLLVSSLLFAATVLWVRSQFYFRQQFLQHWNKFFKRCLSFLGTTFNLTRGHPSIRQKDDLVCASVDCWAMSSLLTLIAGAVRTPENNSTSRTSQPSQIPFQTSPPKAFAVRTVCTRPHLALPSFPRFWREHC